MSLRKEGLFISVEGIDGAGKSTQLVTVREWAYSKGWNTHEVVSVREPGGTVLGETIREMFLYAKKNNLTGAMDDVLLLLVAKKALWNEVIKPALMEGKVVVADRWTDSLYAYQGHGFDVGTAPIHTALNLLAMNHWPHATIWLDIPVAMARERMEKERSPNDINALDLKGEEFFTKVRKGFEYRTKTFRNRMIRVDGSLRENAVAELIHAALDKKFPAILK